jgi:hypothetical protein
VEKYADLWASVLPGWYGLTRGSRWSSFSLYAALSDKAAACASEILHQLKARRRGGGRSAAGPSVYLTGTSEGTQVRGTPPKTPPSESPAGARPVPFRNLHHVATDTM